MKPPAEKMSVNAIAATAAVGRVNRWRAKWSRDLRSHSAPRDQSSFAATARSSAHPAQ